MEVFLNKHLSISNSSQSVSHLHTMHHVQFHECIHELYVRIRLFQVERYSTIRQFVQFDPPEYIIFVFRCKYGWSVGLDGDGGHTCT
jgi:hypothetical protein